MKLILPPSETKRAGGAGPSLDDPAHPGLSYAAALDATRSRVRAALEALGSDPEAAAAALKLGAKSRGDLTHNAVLGSSGTLPAVERYTGVLYDALEVTSLDDQARTWLGAHIEIQSALFGRIAASDLIPSYRLSASSRVQVGDVSLKRVWQEAHQAIGTSQTLVVDARSKEYAALAPINGAYTLEIVTEGADGVRRALGHFNKAAKGRFARALASTTPELTDAGELVDWAAAHGFVLDVDGSTMSLITHAP